ncbi:hypothetical protein [Actinoplanes sp. NPDC051859]|uniref:hypothetical protein n=1 Tax=Actinoplanes sp. NPDC051859 TaxID=3363909 RepID=UPI0037BD81C8
MSKSPNAARRARRAATRGLAVALLPFTAVSAFGGSSPAQAAGDDFQDRPYSLAATVAPAPLTAAQCRADASCEVTKVPDPSSVENHAVLYKAVARAAAKTAPAVLDANGAIVTPAKTATVLIPEGTFKLSRPVDLPTNVNLRGSGIAKTMLVLDTNYWVNFGSIIRAKSDVDEVGSSNLVSDLTVNGSCRIGMGNPDPSIPVTDPGQPCDFRKKGYPNPAKDNTGGGISVADNWTVRQVRFTNLESFKLWVHSAKNVHIVDNRFDNWGGAESHEEDNIGGGGGYLNDNVVIEYNQWDRTIRGNAFDFTNAIRTTVRNNVVHSDVKELMAKRNVEDYGSMFFEGIPEATVTGNLLVGGHIILQSNARYEHTGRNKDVTNPRDTLVANNEIRNSNWAGITASYEDYEDGSGWGRPGTWNDTSAAETFHYVRPGGNNVIRDNKIVSPAVSGILLTGTRNPAKGAPDIITGNTIVNAGADGSLSYSTGAARFDTAGIGVSLGIGDRIFGNTIEDNQARPTTLYGVHVGGRNAKTVTSGTVLTDPAGVLGANVIRGNVATLIRDTSTSEVTEAPTALAVTGDSVVWSESYALQNLPIGGYRVYRNGVQVADFPVGSAAIPGNLLSADDANLTNGVSGWTAGTGTTVSQHTGPEALGGSSLALTSKADGQISATSGMVAVTPGQQYSSTASYQALGASHRARTGIVWFTANGTRIARMLTSNRESVDVAGLWTTSSYTEAAPANAAFAQAFVTVDSTVAGEVHLVDRIGLTAGTATEQFVDPNGTAGNRYHVVSYHATTGQNSATALVDAL